MKKMNWIDGEPKLLMQTLGGLQEENNNLKSRLTDILKKDLSPFLLEQLESFQTRLLDRDASLALLQYEVSLLIHHGAPPTGNGNQLQQRLCRDIHAMEHKIARMSQNLDKLRREAALL